MKLFVDSANLRDIGDALERGFVAGVTTNPSILSKEERRDYREHIADIVDLLTKHARPLPLSVEVFTTDPDEMIVQAESFVDQFGDYKPLTIKIPVGWNELRVIATLAERGIAVNATCGMSLNQAMMAVNAGARYISLFWGRIRDTGYDAGIVVQQVRSVMDRGDAEAEIIVGSIRHIMDVNEAALAGAHIVTVPPAFFPKLCQHPKTDEAVTQFVEDFRSWMAPGG
jgi:transaldolase